MKDIRVIKGSPPGEIIIRVMNAFDFTFIIDRSVSEEKVIVVSRKKLDAQIYDSRDYINPPGAARWLAKKILFRKARKQDSSQEIQAIQEIQTTIPFNFVDSRDDSQMTIPFDFNEVPV